jgi:hypothetical protein
MSFEYACFISYRHHEQSLLAEKFISDLSSALRNELALMIEEDLYLDRERMRGGTFFNPSLARALCKSVCMIVIYTPTYFSKTHPYCAREYRAMEHLEQLRLAKLDRTFSRECGLIIPIVLRGEASLPEDIRANRHYYSFERFSLTSREIAKNKQFEQMVRDIASVIHARKQMFDALGEDLTCDCDEFNFPSNEDISPWLEAVSAPANPFPFRANAR